MLARKALAGTAGAPKVYVEDVFSTYLYTGTGASQTITNNIDLSTEGGLVWLKSRSNATNNYVYDTETGLNRLITNATNGSFSLTDGLSAFNSNGFSLGNDATAGQVNVSGRTYVSWTFRQAKKFFDVVTWTGNGSAGREISHNLGSVPGFIVIKRTDSTGNWNCLHRFNGTNWKRAPGLNLTTEFYDVDGAYFGNGTTFVTPTSTTFTIASNAEVNENGGTFVAYLFAHDAGGFGDAGSDSIIKCGSYTNDGSGNATIDLGWEPQFVITKATSTTGAWRTLDTMRGWNLSSSDAVLLPNVSDAESSATNRGEPTATGFTWFGNASETLIYIAIRRGPMKTPTSGTDVFYSQTISQADSIDSTGVPFPPDLVNTFSRNGTQRTTGYTLFQFADRLRSLGTPDDSYGTTKEGKALVSSGTDAEYGNLTNYSYIQLKADGRNITRSNGWNSASYGNWLNYFWRRAPGFFDAVCYTGTGVSRTVSHNLGVTPELMIVKARSQARDWLVYSSGLTSGYFIKLNLTDAQSNSNYAYIFGNDTSGVAPTSSVFTVGSGSDVNASGSTYVAYLFASVSGVSKVGTYTGNGSSVTVTTDFQPRFILVKRTDSTGDWIVSDSARGLVAGNDPYLELNTTDAEVTNEDWVDISSTSFTVNQTTNNANVNTGTYIYLAIA